jgi:hypothetical protein
MFTLRPIRSKNGTDQVEAGLERARVAAEPLDGPVVALRHRLYGGEDRQDDKDNQRNDENVDPEQYRKVTHGSLPGTYLKCGEPPRRLPAPGIRLESFVGSSACEVHHGSFEHDLFRKPLHTFGIMLRAQ